MSWIVHYCDESNVREVQCPASKTKEAALDLASGLSLQHAVIFIAGPGGVIISKEEILRWRARLKA
jgi:hypothetical protein